MSDHRGHHRHRSSERTTHEHYEGKHAPRPDYSNRTERHRFRSRSPERQQGHRSHRYGSHDRRSRYAPDDDRAVKRSQYEQYDTSLDSREPAQRHRSRSRSPDGQRSHRTYSSHDRRLRYDNRPMDRSQYERRDTSEDFRHASQHRRLDDNVHHHRGRELTPPARERRGQSRSQSVERAREQSDGRWHREQSRKSSEVSDGSSFDSESGLGQPSSSKRSRRRSRSGSRERSRGTKRKDRGSPSRERRRKKQKEKERKRDKDKEERRSVLTGKKIKLKVKKGKDDHERDANREDLLQFLNSTFG